MIDRNTIERILSTAKIEEVVGDFVTLKKAGANLKGLCPFHNEKTPSFVVSPAKGLCKCFSCGKGGNVVHFIMEHEQMSYPEALHWLAKKYNIEIREKELTNEEKKIQGERESLFVINEWANQYFQQIMNETTDGKAIGLNYFRSRGFRDDIIKKFQLGFSLNQKNALVNEAKIKGFKEEFLLKSGLCYKKEDGELHDRFWGRVIFPVHTLSGKIVAFGGRVLDSHTKGVKMKYVNSPESEIYKKSNELYGIYFAKQTIVKEDRCFLVEGYTDVISMHQSGIENVVASSGTSLTEGQIKMIHRFTNNITILYDGDIAGIKASMRGIDMLLAEGMNVKILLLPDGDDPDSFARKHNASEYKDYIDKHQIDFIRFKTDLLLKDAGNDPLKKANLINNIVESIAVIPDQITYTVYIRECCKMMNLEERILVDAVSKRKRMEVEKKRKQVSRETTDSYRDTPTNNINDTQSPDSIKPQTDLNGTQLTSTTDLLKSSEEIQIQKDELLLVNLIIRSGEKIMCHIEDEKGNTIELKIINYISSSLSEDHISFKSAIHQQIIQEALEHVNETGFSCKHYFLAHPDPTISNLAANLLSDRYHLNKTSEQMTKPDDERLLELASNYIFNYKLAIVEKELKQILSLLKDPNTLKDESEYLKIMTHYKELQDTKNILAKELDRFDVK